MTQKLSQRINELTEIQTELQNKLNQNAEQYKILKPMQKKVKKRKILHISFISLHALTLISYILSNILGAPAILSSILSGCLTGFFVLDYPALINRQGKEKANSEQIKLLRDHKIQDETYDKYTCEYLERVLSEQKEKCSAKLQRVTNKIASLTNDLENLRNKNLKNDNQKSNKKIQHLSANLKRSLIKTQPNQITQTTQTAKNIQLSQNTQIQNQDITK